MNASPGKNGNEISKLKDSSLRSAMSNANEMLLLVTKDQSSISQALKMVEEEESPSSLRWYVYPKVRKGNEFHKTKRKGRQCNAIELSVCCNRV